jgi:two-component system OmpR family response regulator
MISTKILLITADDSMATSISTCLTQSGYQVLRSSRGMDALDLTQAEKPGLLILDVETPDFNSMAIIRTLRSTDDNDRLPVILMGSNIREEDALLGLEVGADLCLREAFHPQVFVARVRSLLRRSELAKVR